MVGGEVALGFIGFGEAGYEMAAGLRASGVWKVAACHRRKDDPQRAAFVKSRARAAGVDYKESLEEVVRGSKVVFSVVTPESAEDVARDASRYLEPGQVYFDLTSSEPMAMRKAAQAVEAVGARFVDGAMMASLPIFKHKVLIYASGSAARELAGLLNAYGMNVKVIGEAPGQASAAKMLASVVTKGLEALLVEMLLGAHEYGVEEHVLEAVDQFFTAGFRSLVDRFVGSDAVHATRRVKEMEGAARFLKELGVEPIMTDATVKRLRWSASLLLDRYFKGVSPASYRDVIKAWEEKGLFSWTSCREHEYERS